jgi:quercetin dioxygenase-like cupin family protein
MKNFPAADLLTAINPNPGKPFVLINGKGFDAVLATLLPHSEGQPPHVHDHDCMLIGESGEGVQTIEGQDYLVNPGDIVFIGTDEVHTKSNRSDREFRGVVIHIVDKNYQI